MKKIIPSYEHQSNENIIFYTSLIKELNQLTSKLNSLKLEAIKIFLNNFFKEFDPEILNIINNEHFSDIFFKNVIISKAFLKAFHYACSVDILNKTNFSANNNDNQTKIQLTLVIFYSANYTPAVAR